MLNQAAVEENRGATKTVLFKLISSEDFNEKIELAKTLRLYFPSPIEALGPDEISQLKHPGRSKSFKVDNSESLQEKFSEYRSQVEYLHAIANIELLAVELTALCLLRFGSEDADYIRRQLLTISEKAAHFQMLNNRLQDFGMSFGSLPANHTIWECARRASSEEEHQILVSCYLEAKRLDVSPTFLKKMIKADDQVTTRIMKIILAEEMKHIKLGMTYLKQKAHEKNQDPDAYFRNVITRLIGSDIRSKAPINEEYRRIAGFSHDQINMLKAGA